MYVPCIVYNLLIRPINPQYIKNNVSFIKYCNMFRCIYIIFRGLLTFLTLKIDKINKINRVNLFNSINFIGVTLA